MTILITGANGLIGRALTETYLNAGSCLRLHTRREGSLDLPALRSSSLPADSLPECLARRFPDSRAGRALDSSVERSSECQVHQVVLDFATASAQDYDRLVTGCETIIHTAALVHRPEADPVDYRRINVESTRQLAEAARRRQVTTFVFLSTIAVYGDGPFEGIDEDAALSPATPYAVSKVESEHWLKEQGPCPRILIFRCSLVFGEGDRGNMLGLIRQINRGNYVHPSGSLARKSLIYCRDAAVAIVRAVERAGSGVDVYNLAGSHAPSVEVLAESIGIALGSKRKIPRVPTPVLNAGAVALQALLGKRAPLTPAKLRKLTTTNVCSIAKLERDIELPGCTPLEESLAAEIRWAKATGLL